jgi:hypothetical protein
VTPEYACGIFLWSRALAEKLIVTRIFKKFTPLLWNPKVHDGMHKSL